jgi:hypothetical protein
MGLVLEGGKDRDLNIGTFLRETCQGFENWLSFFNKKTVKHNFVVLF